MAALTRSAPSEQERMSHEMGMRQAFFDIDLNEAAIRAIVPREIDTSDPHDEEVRVWQR
jgi:hypothetical protein